MRSFRRKRYSAPTSLPQTLLGLEESESEGDGDGEALANNDELDEADIGEKSQMRWGIDVGVGVIRQSWRELPERGNNAEQTPTEQ